MYVDESGDLGSQSTYLILSALLVDTPADLDRIIKNMRRNKFRKQLRKANEIKANKSSSRLIKHMIRELNGLSYTAYFMILEKNQVYSEYLNTDKHKLYNFVAGKLAKNIVLEDIDVEVRVDKSKGKQLLREDFNTYFERYLRERSSIRTISIHHSYSHSWSGLQFADILAWSMFQRFEHGNKSYIDLLTTPPEIYHTW